MMTSQEGIDLIKHFEGCQLKSYKCPAGIWTIGYGHTGYDVKEGLEWTQLLADNMLKTDLVKYESALSKLVKVDLSQCQFDALVSFTYNLGSGNLAKSTLLKLLNESDFNGAANQFCRWVNPGSTFEKGLKRRREAERLLFIGGDWRAYVNHVNN